MPPSTGIESTPKANVTSRLSMAELLRWVVTTKSVGRLGSKIRVVDGPTTVTDPGERPRRDGAYVGGGIDGAVVADVGGAPGATDVAGIGVGVVDEVVDVVDP